MLNPSTADASIDDPTIRRCKGFAKDWGYGALTVINLYAFRATDPKELWKASDPVGHNNDKWIEYICANYPGEITFVCAWGANAKPDRVKQFVDLVAKHPKVKLMCLGTTKAGAPKHPLYIKADQPLEPWDASAYQ